MRKREMQQFWDNYSEVPVDGLHPFRAEFIRQQNAEMKNAFDDREQHPLPYLHMSYRLRFHEMLRLDYEKAVGICSSAVKNVETPNTMILFPTLHAIAEHWKGDVEQNTGGLAEMLAEGRNRFIAEITEKEKLKVYEVLMGLMLEDPKGQEGFFEQSGMTKIEFDHRRNRDRFMPFGFLADKIRAYRGTNGVPPNPEAWDDEVMQRVLSAHIQDMSTVRKVPEPVAHLQAAFEFSGTDFTEESLRALGVSRTVATALVAEKKLIPMDRVTELVEAVRASIGDQGIDALLQLWKDQTKGLHRRKTFYGTLQGLMDEDNVKPIEVLEVCGVSASSAKSSGVLRSGLKRGPNTSMPPAAMLGALAHNEAMFEKESKGMQSEFKERWMRSVRHCPSVRARLQFWGVQPESVFTVEELPQYTALVRGEPSSLTERAVLTRIDVAGKQQTLASALKRRIQQQTPVTLQRSIELLCMQKGGVAGTTRKAGIHMEVIEPLLRGDAVIPAFVSDVFAASHVEIPPHAFVELHFRYAEREEAEEFSPVGRAVDHLIAQSKRYPNHFVNELELPLRPRPSHLHQLQFDTADTKTVQQILKALERGEDAVLKSFLQALSKSECVQEGVFEWLAAMDATGRTDVLADFSHLLAMIAVKEEPSEQEPVQTEESASVEALFQKNAALRLWKRGEEFNHAQLWTPEQERGAALLKSLPGVTREELLVCADLMTDFKIQREQKNESEKMKRIKEFVLAYTWGAEEITEDSEEPQEDDAEDTENAEDAEDSKDAEEKEETDEFDDDDGSDDVAPDPRKNKKKVLPKTKDIPTFVDLLLPEGVTLEDVSAFLAKGATAKPGSPMKVAIMAMRQELGIMVNVSDDTKDHGMVAQLPNDD